MQFYAGAQQHPQTPIRGLYYLPEDAYTIMGPAAVDTDSCRTQIKDTPN
jgi:hypothetical protein